jgi:hypothetical protein
VTADGIGGSFALAQCTLNGLPNPYILVGPITVSSGYVGPATFGAVDLSSLNLASGLTASSDYSQPGKIVLRINGPLPATPAPGTLLLAVTGLVVLGLVRSASRRRRAN